MQQVAKAKAHTALAVLQSKSTATESLMSRHKSSQGGDLDDLHGKCLICSHRETNACPEVPLF